MALPITFNNTVFQAGYVGTDDGAPSANFGIDDVSADPITVNGTVRAVGDPITVTGILPGAATSTTTTFYATQYDSSSMVQFTSAASNPSRSSTRLVLSNTQFPTTSPTFASDGDATLNSYTAPVCFAMGTLIRTSRGDVAVEDLAVGDLAVTASGALRPIRWIGSRRTVTRHHADPAAVMPVRIRAGALGEGRPARDLVVSAGHAICFDVVGEVLIPAVSLINGATIVQEHVDAVTYWHVELDSHDLLVAEGQAAESYLDMGNRGYFADSTDGVSTVDLAAGPDAAARTDADYCRPFHIEGPVVGFVRERIRARAEAHGWRLAAQDPWAGVHLLADGVRVEPEVNGMAARFRAPAGAEVLWLVSPASAPSKIGMGDDPRRLGLRLSEVRLGDGWDAQAVTLDDGRLYAGFHDAEGQSGALRRWTADRALLPAALWPGDDRTLVLHLDPTSAALPCWVGPADGVASSAPLHRHAA